MQTQPVDNDGEQEEEEESTASSKQHVSEHVCVRAAGVNEGRDGDKKTMPRSEG